MNTEIDNLIQSVRDGKDLTQEQTAHVFSDLMGGQLSGNQIDALLVALADKGETVDEIVGAARVMRKHAVHIPCDNPDAIDTCAPPHSDA